MAGARAQAVGPARPDRVWREPRVQVRGRAPRRRVAAGRVRGVRLSHTCCTANGSDGISRRYPNETATWNVFEVAAKVQQFKSLLDF
jgi:hypothetical protein